MKILWLGIDDTGGCVLHWHKLRLRLKQEYGVTLAGPGYSWPFGENRPLSEIARGSWDWIVLDDCNAKGYVPVRWDIQPDAKIAWREHDWHNRRRQEVAHRIKPDIVLGCYERPLGLDPIRSLPGWRLIPQAVDTEWFHANGQARRYAVGLYGQRAKCYPARCAAWRVMGKREDAWRPTHGGYWHSGKKHNDGISTFYNENLATALQEVKTLWVDGGKWAGCVLKFFEGAASGCLLVGEEPHGWEACFPRESMIRCAPDDLESVVDFYDRNEALRRAIAIPAMIHCRSHHSIEARAKQIVEVLECHT